MAKKVTRKTHHTHKAHHPALVIAMVGMGITGVILMFGLMWSSF